MNAELKRKEGLIDINQVVVDESMPLPERINNYLKQIKNPYLYLDGGVVVKLSFANNGISFIDCIKQCIKTSITGN